MRRYFVFIQVLSISFALSASANSPTKQSENSENLFARVSQKYQQLRPYLLESAKTTTANSSAANSESQASTSDSASVESAAPERK